MIRFLQQMYDLHNDYTEIKRKLNNEIKNNSVLKKSQQKTYSNLIKAFSDKYLNFKTQINEYYYIVFKKVAVLERKLVGIPVIETRKNQQKNLVKK